MDLDEYRRIYMTMEGVSNTPLNAIKRVFRLGKDIGNIPKAAKMDRKKREKQKEKRQKAIDEMKKDGVSIDGVKEVIKNIPFGNKNTTEALTRAGRSATAVGKSVNELGSTTKSIVGTSRTNPYDGQDLEQGISLALNAHSAINRGLHMPVNAVKNALSVGHFGSMTIKHAGNTARVKIEKVKEMQKDFDMDR